MTSQAVGKVLSLLDSIRSNGDAWSAKCPAHEDHDPSLSIAEGEAGRVLLHCHAGCETSDVMKALGLTDVALFDDSDTPRAPKGEWTPRGPATAIYSYFDEGGDLLFQVLRTADKQFPQRRPDTTTKSGWAWNLHDVRRVLYRLPKVIEAVATGEQIWIAEGEKDVQALEAAGLVATCNPGGAGKWRSEFSEVLADADVIVCADADAPGRKHAHQIARSLREVASSVEIVEAPNAKDVAEHFGRGQSIAELEVTNTTSDPIPDLVPDLYEFLAETDHWDWIVPGLLERGDRLILTGFEGWGKSVLVRMLAICMSAGIHPFTLASMPPVKVLFIDCENGRDHTRRKFRTLEMTARNQGRPVPPGQLRIKVRPEGLDLLREEDQLWLDERVVACKPDVLFIGSLYKMHSADPKDEAAARAASSAIDAVRVRANCAVIIEAHAGHGDRYDRGLRPLGSSLWMRWPEFGFGLKPLPDTDPEKRSPLAFHSWRGPRDERDWPDRIERGTVWPWVGVYDHGMPGSRLHAVTDTA